MNVAGIDSQRLLGAFLALLMASVTVLYVCHVSIQERLKRVPMKITGHPQAVLFASVCGLVAVVAFWFTDGTGSNVVDSVLSLKQTNAPLRGVCVGLTVLVLIRSKLSSIKGAEVGGELAYNTGRVWVMGTLNERWQRFKREYTERNLPTALTIADFEDRLLGYVRAATQIQPEDYRVYMESQILNLQKSRPATALDVNASWWRGYYRSLLNLALDYAGPSVFNGWTNFR